MFVLAVAGLSGCFLSHEPEAACEDEAVPGTDVDVDLLFVIDNSPSMATEQSKLADQMDPLIDLLVRGDGDGDGTRDFPSPRSLHLGVVTTDGDGQMEPLPGGARFLRLSDTEGDPVVFAREAAHLIQVGTDGSGNEMPLRAAARALLPSDAVSPRDPDLWPSYGDTLHRGFLRSGSILLVLIVTDEDDGSPGTVAHYTYALHTLRPAGGLVVGLIAGVPLDLVTGPAPASPDAILADPRMAARDTWAPPIYACGAALPARRLVDLMALLPDESVLVSICENDYADVLAPIVQQLSGEILESACGSTGGGRG